MTALDSSTNGVASLSLLQLWQRSLAYLHSYRLESGLVLLALVIDIAFSLTFNYVVKVLIDGAVSHQSENTLAPILAGLAGFFVVATLAGLSRDYVSADIETKLGNELRLTLLRHLQALSVDFYGRAHLGDLLARMGTDVTTIKAALTKAFPTVVYRLLQVVGCLVFLVILDWRLTVLTLIVLPLSLVVPRLFVARSMVASYRQGQADASVVADLQEQLAGQAVIRAFGLEQVMSAALAQRLREVAKVSIPASRFGRLIRTTSGLGITVLTFTITTVGVVLVFHHELSVGSLVGFVGVLNLLGQACFRLTEALPEWLAATGSILRVEEILAEQPAIEDRPDAGLLPRIGQEIRFADVSFGYGADRHTLHHVDFTIRAGQAVALVGKSGSGKSTVLSLLMRLYDPTQGAITIDGHDLSAVRQESLRAQLSVVFQETFLFNRSIRENIRLGRPSATDAEVEDAARAAQIHHVITALPHCYETEVGERGGLLSGGQRQRIALARALLRDPAILILDEATSALDPATEAAFISTLEQLSRNHTVISVTHRLSTVTGADWIIVLDDGDLREQGTHEDLLQRGSLYRQLWDQQTGFLISQDGLQAALTPARLRQVPLFASADDAILAALAGQFVSRRYTSDEVIVREGEVADAFYIIVRGSLEVVTTGPGGREQRVAVQEDGEFFGEIGLLRGVVRTSTVRTLTPSLLLVLTRQQFETLMQIAPELRAVVEREAADRLQRTSALSA